MSILLTEGLISYWKLDELSGNVIDSFGINDGYLSGATYNPTQGVSGKINTSYDFAASNGSDSTLVICPYNSSQDMSNGKITMTAWLYSRTTGNDGISSILCKNYSPTAQNVPFDFGIKSNGGSERYLYFRYAENDNWINTIYSSRDYLDYFNVWTHVAITIDQPNDSVIFYINEVGETSQTGLTSSIPTSTSNLHIGEYWSDSITSLYNNFNGKIDEIGLWNKVLSSDEINYLYNDGMGKSYPFYSDNSRLTFGKDSDYGKLPSGDDNSISLDSFKRFQTLLKRSSDAGSLIINPIFSTFSLLYTVSEGYIGGVLSPNGDIHFIPYKAPVGFKINYITGVQSTYSLVYTTSSGAYRGGVLAPNGDVHFVPCNAIVGQKINSSGVVSTYSLVYTASAAYVGGVVDPKGYIHFVPQYASRGQKISPTGVVSTYNLLRTTAGNTMFSGGVLAPNGDIHFIPDGTDVGQKVNINGTVSTYSLVYTTSTNGYSGGVLSPNGDIHMIPRSNPVGQKIDINGVVSTYSIIVTGLTFAYSGGVLAPDGSIHMSPLGAPVGTKIDINGVVSTYSIGYTAAHNNVGAVLTPNGDIYFITQHYSSGQKISILSANPFSLGVCCHPFFNKL